MKEAAYPNGGPMALSEQSVLDVLRQLLGTHATLGCWYVRTDTYAVASVVADERSVVKLEAPSARRSRRFELIATFAHMVRAETTVPVVDVVAVGYEPSKMAIECADRN